MNKMNRKNMKDIWRMRNLTVKDFFENLSKHPDLKFLLTAAGSWWLIKMTLFVVLACNVFYYVIRIFDLVLS